MEDTVSAVLDELLDQETLTAFREAWPSDARVAAAEAANIAELLTRPGSNELKSYIGRLAQGLVGSQPDLLAWLRALTEKGGFELRRPSRPPGNIPSPGRAIESAVSNLRTKERQLNPAQSSAYLEGKRERVRMLTAATLVLKLRESVQARAAIGPGWTLMQAVGESKDADLQRKLHRFGADATFRHTLLSAVREAVAAWLESADAGNLPQDSRAAEWKRSTPPGVDVVGYFTDEAIETYRTSLFSELDLPKPEAHQRSLAPAEDAATIKQARPSEVQPEEFSYYRDETGDRIVEMKYSAESEARVQEAMPLLRASNAADLMAMAATRAYHRRIFRRSRRVDKASVFGDALEDEIANWVEEKGFPPPPHMRLQDAYLFEEEACFVYLLHQESWNGLQRWRELGFFPDPPVQLDDLVERERRLRKPFPPSIVPT